MMADADELIAGARLDLERAANNILSAAEQGLALLAGAPAGGPVPVGDLERLLQEIIHECAFEDIASQRLSRLSTGGLRVIEPRDPLLAGPQIGSGLDQAAADAVFASR